MNAKQLYHEKLLALATMSRHIEQLRACLTDLNTIEERFPDPDFGELYGLNVALDELSAQVAGMASAVGVLVQSSTSK